MAGKGRGKRADEGRTNARRVITAFVLAAAFAACAVAVPVAVSPRAERAVVVVDAGHGGADGGVTGVNTGVKESDLNLAMSFLIGGCLEGMGFEVVYTRTGKGGLYDETDRDKKSADMHRRGEIIRASAPSAVLSVHMNIFFERGRRGAQVFFDRSSEGGRALAEGIQTALNEGFNLRSPRFPQRNSSCNKAPRPPSSWNAAFFQTPRTRPICSTPITPCALRRRWRTRCTLFLRAERDPRPGDGGSLRAGRGFHPRPFCGFC